MSAVIHGPQKLQMLCMTSKDTKKTQRLHPKTKQPLDIWQYQYKHQAGIAYFYSNDTDNMTLKEHLKFQLAGLAIVGNKEGDTEVQFTIGPGETKFIELSAIGGQWKIGCGMAYSIM
jgi:hypothetical protein